MAKKRAKAKTDQPDIRQQLPVLVPGGESLPEYDRVLDELIGLVRKSIWIYSDLMLNSEIKVDTFGKHLEVMGRGAARLGRLVEISKKWGTTQDGMEKFKREVIKVIEDLDQSRLELEEENHAERA